jgi:hypothetical protein
MYAVESRILAMICHEFHIRVSFRAAPKTESEGAHHIGTLTRYSGAEVAREERLREGRGEGDAQDLTHGAEEV